MADFIIWGRIEHIGPREFLAITTAISASGHGDDLDVVPQIATSREDAVTLLKATLVLLGERVRARGHNVVDVETEGI